MKKVKAITKIVKRHEAIDGHKSRTAAKVTNDHKTLKQEQKLWTTTTIMDLHRNYESSQKLWAIENMNHHKIMNNHENYEPPQKLWTITKQ